MSLRSTLINAIYLSVCVTGDKDVLTGFGFTLPRGDWLLVFGGLLKSGDSFLADGSLIYDTPGIIRIVTEWLTIYLPKNLKIHQFIPKRKKSNPKRGYLLKLNYVCLDKPTHTAGWIEFRAVFDF